MRAVKGYNPHGYVPPAEIIQISVHGLYTHGAYPSSFFPCSFETEGEKPCAYVRAARRETSGGDLFARTWGERINFVVT